MNKKWFTLVELIVVITILSVLFSVIFIIFKKENKEKMILDNSSNSFSWSNCFKTSDWLLSCDKSSVVTLKNTWSIDISNNYLNSNVSNINDSVFSLFVIMLNSFLPFIMILFPIFIIFSFVSRFFR